MSRAKWLGLVMAGSFLGYANTLGHGLAGFDDEEILERLDSRRPREPLGARTALSRTLRDASHALDLRLYGRDYRGHHLSSVLLHAAASGAAFWAALALLAPPSAAAAALLFSWHPLQTESVAYLAGRRDLLMGLFTLLGFAVWARRRAGPAPPMLAASAWVLGLLAKPTAIVLPWLVLALEHVRGRATRTWLALAWAALAAALALWAGSVEFALEPGRSAQHHANPFWHGGGPLANWSMVPVALARALELLLWPARLCADYSHKTLPEADAPWAAPALLSLLALSAAAAAAWRLSRGVPAARFGLFWLGAAYLPHLPWIPNAHNLQLFAEHWLYLPLFGAGLFFGGLLERLPERRRALAAALVLLPLLGRTLRRSADWRDDLTLWQATVRTAPECARARNNLGWSLLLRGRAAEAEREFRAALSVDRTWIQPRRNLVEALASQGRFEEALSEAERVRAAGDPEPVALQVHLRLRSGDVRGAHELCRRPARERSTVATVSECVAVLIAMGRWDTLDRLAGEWLPRARDPHARARLLEALGAAALERGQVARAEELFRQRLELRADASARASWALALGALGRRDEALEALAQALRAGLPRVKALAHRAFILRRSGELAGSLSAAEEALAASPRDVDALSQLAQSLEAAGKAEESDQAFARALVAADLPRDYLLWSRALRARGRRAEAAELASRGRARHPYYAPLRAP